MRRGPRDEQTALQLERGLLLGCFVLSRALFYATGVTFDLRPLASSWQLLDPVLLRNQLLESVFYMAGQPPLYNLLIGAFLKLSPDASTLALLLRGVYAGLSLLTCVCLHELLQGLSIGRGLRVAAVLLFMLSPALVLYENIPYYTLHEVALLTLCTLLFQRLLASFSTARALALFTAMATLIYVRSLFQLYWLVALAGFCLLILPSQRKQLLYALIAPLALVLALYAKNALNVGHFGTSHWLGLSATKLSCLELPKAERTQLVAEHKLSRLALRPAYETPERLSEYVAGTPRTGHPVLDDARKSTGYVNYNQLAYVAVARDSMNDALYTMAHHPRVYLRSVARAWRLFLRPASDYPFLKENRDALGNYSRLYSHLIAGQPIYPEDPQFAYERGQLGYALAAGFFLVAAFGVVIAARWLRHRSLSSRDALLLFMWLNVAYVSVVGNAFELDENQRFRFALHPLLICMLCVLAVRVRRAMQQRAQRARNCSAESPSASIQR